MNVNVADVTRPPAAVGELQRRGMTVVMWPHGTFATRSRVAKLRGGNLELGHSNGAYRMPLTLGENGTKVVAPMGVQETSMPVTRFTSELPSVEDTSDKTKHRYQ